MDVLTRRQALGGGLALLALAACGAPASSVTRCDVLVYGGTPAGITAAVTAAHLGLRSVLVLGESPLGGMVTNGLGHTDLTQPAILGGWTREFFALVGAAYGRDEPAYDFAPSVATQVFTRMLADAGVQFVQGTLRHATASGGRVESVQLDDGSTYAAPTFVDASYEGDLIGHAGLPYVTGREPSSRYGESVAGFRAATTSARWTPASGFPEGFLAAPPTDRTRGSGDDRTMAYNFRLCLTKDLARGTRFVEPPGYDADAFHAALPLVTGTGPINAVALPGGKYDLNSSHDLMTDVVNASRPYPTAGSVGARQAIVARHKAYTQGLLHHLSTDARVPEALRAEVTQYALAADEFTDNGNWPAQLYVRASRRLVGRHVLTQEDVSSRADRDDAVAYAAYAIDCHTVQQFRDADGSVSREGTIVAPDGLKPEYAVPFDVIRPANTHSNVLAPVCTSASHVAYCSLRMEPHFMLLGEAAGAAAAVAHAHGTGTGNVTADEVRSALRSKDSVLSTPF